MSLLPAFSPSRSFVASVLPGLVPRAPALTHLVASYRRIGVRMPPSQTEIYRDGELTTMLFHELTPGRIQDEVVRVLVGESDPSAPLIATVYAGKTQFVEMAQLIMFLLKERPEATILVTACGCITVDQEAVIRQGMFDGKIAAAAWCDCGGSLMTRDIRRAVTKNWKPVEADIQLSPRSTESSVDLGA